LLIYDVTNRASFEHIRDWLAQVKEYAKDEVALTLVGNKVDLGHQRKVRADEGRQLAKVIGRVLGGEEGIFVRERNFWEGPENVIREVSGG